MLYRRDTARRCKKKPYTQKKKQTKNRKPFTLIIQCKFRIIPAQSKVRIKIAEKEVGKRGGVSHCMLLGTNFQALFQLKKKKAIVNLASKYQCCVLSYKPK